MIQCLLVVPSDDPEPHTAKSLDGQQIWEKALDRDAWYQWRGEFTEESLLDVDYIPESDILFVRISVVYVNAWHVTREYGGPEEGGWYYNEQDLLASIPCERSEAEVIKTVLLQHYQGLDDPQPIYNVLSKGKLIISIDHQPGQSSGKPVWS